MVASKLNLKIILIIVGVLAVGAAATYSFWQMSDKDAYFKAEIDTYNYAKELFVERFEDEFKWKELTENKPTEFSMHAMVQYNDPNSFGSFNQFAEMINQSSIQLKAATDMKNKQMLLDAEINIYGITIEDLQIYLTDQALTINLPFLKDALHIDSGDLNGVLHDIDPHTFSANDEMNFDRLFDLDNYPMSAADQEYLQENYGKFIYEILPERSFSKEKDSITINGESISADKLSFSLTEDEIKTVLLDLLEKAAKDEQLKEIVGKYFENSYVNAAEIDTILSTFDEGLEEAKESIENMPFKGQIQSHIWVNKGLIVQRELTLTGENEFGQTGIVNIAGTHQLEKSHQIFDYELSIGEEDNLNHIMIVVDLLKDGKQIDDQITIELDDTEIVYEGIETLDRSARDFKRSLSLNTPYEQAMIHWDGNSSFERDQMSSMNKFSMTNDHAEEIFALNFDIEGKEIRAVEVPDYSNIKDIGKMSEAELENYIFTEVQPQLFNWLLFNVGLPSF